MNKKPIFILTLIIPMVLLGQEKSIPINISVFNEATAIPFTRFVTIPMHPGLQLGTECNYKAKEHTRFFQTINLNYFYHNQLNHFTFFNLPGRRCNHVYIVLKYVIVFFANNRERRNKISSRFRRRERFTFHFVFLIPPF